MESKSLYIGTLRQLFLALSNEKQSVRFEKMNADSKMVLFKGLPTDVQIRLIDAVPIGESVLLLGFLSFGTLIGLFEKLSIELQKRVINCFSIGKKAVLFDTLSLEKQYNLLNILVPSDQGELFEQVSNERHSALADYLSPIQMLKLEEERYIYCCGSEQPSQEICDLCCLLMNNSPEDMIILFRAFAIDKQSAIFPELSLDDRNKLLKTWTLGEQLRLLKSSLKRLHHRQEYDVFVTLSIELQKHLLDGLSTECTNRLFNLNCFS